MPDAPVADQRGPPLDHSRRAETSIRQANGLTPALGVGVVYKKVVSLFEINIAEAGSRRQERSALANTSAVARCSVCVCVHVCVSKVSGCLRIG